MALLGLASAWTVVPPHQTRPRSVLYSLHDLRTCDNVDNINKQLDGSAAPNAAALRRVVQLYNGSSSKSFLTDLLLRVGAVPAHEWTNLATADVLAALLVLGQRGASVDKLQAFTALIWSRLDDHSLHQLSPKRWTECIRAFCYFGLESDTAYRQLCRRMAQGDALAASTPADLAWLASVMTTKSPLELEESQLLRAVARRLRKQSVRTALTVTQLTRVLASVHAWHGHSQDDSNMRQEMERLLYTLSKQALTISVLRSGQLAVVFQSASVLQLSASDALVTSLRELLAEHTLEDASLYSLSTILSALARWRGDDLSSMVRRAGERLVVLLDSQSTLPSPLVVNGILRGAVLSHGHDRNVMEPFVNACGKLFQSTDFMASCQASQVCNFAWFARRARIVDPLVAMVLAERLLQVTDDCTPRTASRGLVLFADLLDHQDNADCHVLRARLFDRLGIHMLSAARLPPLDISSTIQAYAKACYTQDVGIFDSLVAVMASRLNEFGTRQIAQCLWACGKMKSWETMHAEDDMMEDDPPYVELALQWAKLLGDRSEELTVKDATQALWALGHLLTDDPETVSVLARRAKELSAQLNGREVSNILWSLSKNGSRDFDVVYELTRRFAASPAVELNPQECANILYAMAKLDIRDDVIFGNLANHMLDQLASTSAQAIATALWAHRAVHITPPRQLLDRWAHEKLGLVAVQPRLIDV